MKPFEMWFKGQNLALNFVVDGEFLKCGLRGSTVEEFVDTTDLY
jgi:hypothetical protein